MIGQLRGILIMWLNDKIFFEFVIIYLIINRKLMKILHIIDSLEMGGAENLLIPLTAEQKYQGNIVSVLLLKKASNPTVTKKIQDNGISVSWLTEGSLYNPLLIFKLRPFLKHYDIVHVHLFPALYWVGFAKWITNSSTPLIYTEHSTNNRRRQNLLLKYVDRIVYQYAYRHVIACSEKARETFIQAYPNIRHITPVNNGVDIKQNIQAVPYTKQELLGISENSFLVTMVARFMFMKRQDTIVEAIAKLPSQFHACLVGSEPEDEGLIKVKELAENLGVSDRVHFLYIRSDVPRILKTSDVVIMSSEYEGLSLSSIEGMAAGKPFIATNVNGLKEVVSGAGELFELYNSDQLAKILLKLESDKDYYAMLANRCSQRASEYDIKIMVNNYTEIYKRVL